MGGVAREHRDDHGVWDSIVFGALSDTGWENESAASRISPLAFNGGYQSLGKRR